MSKQTDLINIPDAITVDGSNNVGIGTSSPTRQLDVSKAGTAYIRASNTANSVNMEMLAASSGGWIGTQTNHSLMFQTNNAERMRIDSDGLKFNGDTAAANALNDYEEGTWTPTAVGGVTSFNIIGATYTKVGRNVSIAVYLTGQSGTSANMLQIGGLPFTPMSENYNIGPMDGTGSGRQGFARTNHSSTTINSYYTDSTSGVRQNLNGNDSSGHILFGLTYQTT
jgi:hypothetical protein